MHTHSSRYAVHNVAGSTQHRNGGDRRVRDVGEEKETELLGLTAGQLIKTAHRTVWRTPQESRTGAVMYFIDIWSYYYLSFIFISVKLVLFWYQFFFFNFFDLHDLYCMIYLSHVQHFNRFLFFVIYIYRIIYATASCFVIFNFLLIEKKSKTKKCNIDPQNIDYNIGSEKFYRSRASRVSTALVPL